MCVCMNVIIVYLIGKIERNVSDYERSHYLRHSYSVTYDVRYDMTCIINIEHMRGGALWPLES